MQFVFRTNFACWGVFLPISLHSIENVAYFPAFCWPFSREWSFELGDEMKRLGPLLSAWCLLIALGVLLSGVGLFDAGKAPSRSAAVDEEMRGGIEKDDFSDAAVVLSGPCCLDAMDFVFPFPFHFSSDASVCRRLPLHPVGWQLPVRV